MKTIPVHNPEVPFLGKIPGGMRNGLVIKIRGHIEECSNRIIIDLQQGPAIEKDDVMLHLSVRPQENSIVRNHFFNQKWGCEERCGGCPIRVHECFEITIVAEAAFYKISVNGQHFCTFNHRLSMHLARYISVRGACNIEYILVENVMETIPVHNPVMPFLGQIPGGMRNGLVLKIRGLIEECSNRIIIDFQQGPAIEKDDVMLHLSVRPHENSIVRNHFFNQKWGCEERCGGCPIRVHECFEITIVAEAAFYKISVNGQHFCTFNHRLSMHLARYISVRGIGNIQYILVDNDVNSGANCVKMCH